MAAPLRLHPAPPADGGLAGPQLPHNVEAEAALLGAMMLDNRLVGDLQQQLKPDHFFEPAHRRIYEALLRQVDRDMVANPVTLRPLFEADEALAPLGGAGYLAKLTGSGAALVGARDFARQIHELAMLRALVGVGREMVERALDTSEEIDPREQIESAETELYRVAEEGGGERRGVMSFGEASQAAIVMAEKALNAGGGLSGVTTGLDTLNAKLGGLHSSDLVILAGRPGMGKSSLATNIGFNAAKRWCRDREDGIAPERSVGAKVALFSLEMSADQLATRILSEQSGLSSEALRMGKIGKSEFVNLARAASDLNDLPLYIDDTAGLTISALRTRARRLKRRHGIGLIIVDYLQLLQGTGRAGEGNRVQEISEISRGLKTLAKELDVPVLALSQLSRQVESREDKRPQLSDLRESGSIEQDADIVLFLYREEYYHANREPADRDSEAHRAWLEEGEKVHGRCEVIVAKQRHGATGKVNLAFESRITRFSDLAEDQYYGG